MFAVRLTAEWMAWVAALAAPLHRRRAGRRAEVVLGLVRAWGRRTAPRGWRAAAIGDRFRSSSDFLDAVGRTAAEHAAVLVGTVLNRIDSGDRLLVARDDTPTPRSGPTVPGAGRPHHPTPGPAGSTFLDGPRGVVLRRIGRPPAFGVLGLPLLGRLDVPTRDVPRWPPSAGITVRITVE